MFLTLESNFTLEQELEDKISSDLYQNLLEFPHHIPEIIPDFPFQKNISELELTNARGLPPLSIMTDQMKYSSLPSPAAMSKYDTDIYWAHAEAYPNVNDPYLRINSDQMLFVTLKDYEASYLTPTSPRMHKKQKSLDDNSSSTLCRTTPARKKTIINPCDCSGSCNQQIALLYMRGPVHELEKSYVIDVLCNSCINKRQIASPFIPFQYVQTARKRSRDDLHAVECEVCRTKIGNGGIRPVDYAKNMADDLTVEFVCSSCASKYQFCSECGGGGKTRTGKWRPIEMFEKGRRTCALPHLRVGDSHFNTVCYSQSELTGAIISQIQDVFFDSYLSYYAGPTFMKIQNNSFEDLIKETIMPLWNEGVLRYISSPPPKDVSRYIIIEWIDKQHRNKAKAKAQKQEGSNSWLKIIKDQNLMTRINQSSQGDSSGDLNCISFGIAEWDHKKRTVFFPQILPRSFFTRSLQVYDHIIHTAINCIEIDSIRDRISLPRYVVVFGTSDNTKIKGTPERLGFLGKDVFVTENPRCKDTIDSLDNPLFHYQNPSLHICHMEQLLRPKEV